MTRDDIIRMARQTDLHERVKDGVGYVVRIPNLEKLQRFAALVAAAEREACAKECEGLRRFFSGTSLAVDYENYSPGNSLAYTQCAEAIRARSEQEQPR